MQHAATGVLDVVYEAGGPRLTSVVSAQPAFARRKRRGTGAASLSRTMRSS